MEFRTLKLKETTPPDIVTMFNAFPSREGSISAVRIQGETIYCAAVPRRVGFQYCYWEWHCARLMFEMVPECAYIVLNGITFNRENVMRDDAIEGRIIYR